MFLGMDRRRMVLAAGALTVGLVMAGCGSGGTSATTTSPTSPPGEPTSTPGPPPSSTAGTAPAPSTTAAATIAVATCPTLAQAEAALGGSFAALSQNSTPGGGIVCEYTGGAGGVAGVTIFAHQSATVFAGQVAHAPGAPAMPAISGVGDGAFGMTTAGRSIVNAYANASRTLVAAQASSSLASVEALARVALAAN
jgi:hypothetical protein